MNLTPKTYTWLKPLITLGSIGLLIDPLFIFLKILKGNNFFLKNWNTIVLLTTILYGVTILSFFLYGYFRLKYQRASSYQQKSKDKIFLKLSFFSYGLSLIFAGIYLTVALILKNEVPGAYVLFGICYPLIFIAIVTAAIFEAVARLPEQVYLYQEQEKAASAATQQKPTDEIEAETPKKMRTLEAEHFLNREQQKKPADPELTDGYNPFL